MGKLVIRLVRDEESASSSLAIPTMYIAPRLRYSQHMDEETKQLHIAAGRHYGWKATHGTKINYKSEESGQRACVAMMAKGAKELEAYPCAFCDGWHIGRKMTEEELNAFA